MESCPGSQWLARKLQASGHTVKIIPAQFVKPYVKSNKKDMVDAAAIAEAVTSARMPAERPHLYGDGHASERIAEVLVTLSP